jgi:hypothetical protein
MILIVRDGDQPTNICVHREGYLYIPRTLADHHSSTTRERLTCVTLYTLD